MAPRMRIFERRALTEGERKIAADMFETELDLGIVRLWQAPPGLFGAMVPHRRTIVFSRWRAPRDFAYASLTERAWFVHELTHVWQAQHGTRLALAKLRALGNAAYAYAWEAGKPLRAYNIEQQAEIARHLFLARAGAPAPGAPDRARLDALWARRRI